MLVVALAVTTSMPRALAFGTGEVITTVGPLTSGSTVNVTGTTAVPFTACGDEIVMAPLYDPTAKPVASVLTEMVVLPIPLAGFRPSQVPPDGVLTLAVAVHVKLPLPSNIRSRACELFPGARKYRPTGAADNAADPSGTGVNFRMTLLEASERNTSPEDCAANRGSVTAAMFAGPPSP